MTITVWSPDAVRMRVSSCRKAFQRLQITKGESERYTRRSLTEILIQKIQVVVSLSWISPGKGILPSKQLTLEVKRRHTSGITEREKADADWNIDTNNVLEWTLDYTAYLYPGDIKYGIGVCHPWLQPNLIWNHAHNKPVQWHIVSSRSHRYHVLAWAR